MNIEEGDSSQFYIIGVDGDQEDNGGRESYHPAGNITR